MRKSIPLAVSGLLMAFVGCYMILRPDDFLSVVIGILGFYIVADGVRSAVSLIRFRSLFSGAVRTMAAVKAAVNAVLGLIVIALAISKPSLLLTIVIYLVAADFLFTAVMNFIDSMVLARSGMMYGTLGMEAVVSFIISIILFLFPGFIGSVVMTLLAALLLAAGAVMIYAAFTLRREKI